MRKTTKKTNAGFAREVASRRKQVSALRRSTRENKRAASLSAQRVVLEMIAVGVPLPEILHQLCLVIEKLSRGMLCSILILAGLKLRHGAAPSLPEAYSQAIDGLLIGPDAGSCGTAAYRKEPVIVTKIAADPLWIQYRELALSHDLRACWSTPILSPTGSVLGTFAMYYREPRSPSAEDLELIEISTHLAGIAIERKRAEEALRRAHDELEARVVERTTSLASANKKLEAEITERQQAEEEKARLEEELRASQKLEAVGQLAGGIAHDFNNLLTVITGYSQLLLARLGQDDPSCHEIEQIDQAGARAAGLTQKLLAFSRKQVLSPKVLDLNGVVANMETQLQRLIGEDITLVTSTDPALWRVKADPGQLEQVLMNLGVNARDAMPEGGKITIETQNVELDAAYASAHDPVLPGSYVMLAVSDTGCGMDAGTQAHMFEPFFTTKEQGKGTGLGLAMVYGIVKQSGGYVWLYSEPGIGTAVKIFLPRVTEAQEDTPAAPGPAVAPGGSETILLVEDEGMVRNFVQTVLHTHGYTVLTGWDGPEALRLSQEHAGPIALLITDMVMPGMSGRETADRLAATRPETRVLYMSGYTDKAIVQHGMLDPGIAFLQKPFTPDALLRKAREVLDATG